MSSAAYSLVVCPEALSDAGEHRLVRVLDACADALYRFFWVRCGRDPHLADDLMQQLFLQATGRHAHVPEGELEYWLRGIARNLLITHWRRKAARPAHVPLPDAHLAANLADRLAGTDLPDADLARREVQDQLMLALTELPAAEQELIVGHYFDGRSQADLGAELGLSARAVEGRLYRARASLREKLRHLA